MKKLIALFFLLLACCSFIDAYYQTAANDVNHSVTAIKKIGRTFLIPDSSLTMDSDSWDRVYPLLNEAAQKSKVNLIRTSMGYNSKEEPQITFFLLASHPSKLYHLFTLNEGRYPSIQEIDDGSAFLSSQKTKNQQQIGQLKTFSQNPISSIQPLKKLVTFGLPVSGRYIVETTDANHYNQFVHYFLKSINGELAQKGIRPFSQSELTQGNNGGLPDDFGISGADIIEKFSFLPYLIFIATIVLLIYYGFYTAKRIGIMKLHGIGTIRIWFDLLGLLIINTFFLSTLGCFLVLMAWKGLNSLFLVILLKNQLIIYGTLMLASLIIIPYISSVRVSDAIQNHKRTRGILWVNTVIKVACTLLVLGASFSTLNNYVQLKDKQEQLRVWKNTGKASEYGLFYPRDISYGLIELIAGNGSQQYIYTQFLYPHLNRAGALYVNASDYETSMLNQPLPDGDFRTVSVNPNYLRQFPLYDNKGQRVSVAEQTKSWIVLVPEQYKNKKKLILQSNQKDRNENFKNMIHEHEYVSSQIEHQQIKIIWLKKNQKLFSFDPLVFPYQRNIIIDPIINVVTEKNSTDLDGMGFISGAETSTLKVKLFDQNAQKTMQNLEPTLKKLHLETYLRHLVSINDAIKQSIADIQRQMNLLMALVLGLLSCSLILIVQNSVIFFSKYRQKFLVRRLLGAGLIYSYKEYEVYFIVTWVFQFVLGQFIFNQALIQLITLCSLLMLIEAAVSLIALSYIERSNFAKMLKEGA